MSFIQEKTITINLRLSKPYKLIQFSDVHVATYNQQTDDQESIHQAINQEQTWMKQRQDFASKFNEPFDSKSMLSSVDCLNQLIDYANHEDPDLVLLTGDIIDYYSPSNYNFLIQSVKNIHAPYLFSCGNHEYPPENFLELCNDSLEFNMIEFNDFLVVSIDNSKRKITAAQLKAFESILERGKPIIIAMHIPMMTTFNFDEFSKFDDYYTMKYSDLDVTTNQFIQTVTSCEQVKAIFCGHIHGSMVSFVAPNIPQYCCSSGLIGYVNKIIIK